VSTVARGESETSVLWAEWRRWTTRSRCRRLLLGQAGAVEAVAVTCHPHGVAGLRMIGHDIVRLLHVREEEADVLTGQAGFGCCAKSEAHNLVRLPSLLFF